MTYHRCDAVVVGCIDFRFRDFLRSFNDRYLSGKTHDTIRYAGATKELFMVLNQIDVSVRLHKVRQVVLVHHEDCGAYGEEDNLKRHSDDLNKAKRVIHALYPDLQVDLFYMKLDGSCEALEEPEATSP